MPSNHILILNTLETCILYRRGLYSPKLRRAFRLPYTMGIHRLSKRNMGIGFAKFTSASLCLCTTIPETKKSFYMRINDSPYKAEPDENVALLIPGLGKLADGSVRKESAERLNEIISEGLEKLISWITGIENIKDCTPGRLLMYLVLISITR
ncbi:hypothetical protein DL96DRAFT_1079750 [Flagelloscypha sp. PMI_526]|nr:hypothetical protein DL96DRAFT_1079750 [Flagelloscypha sp. PMI_526]